ncbi:hypothetical protein, partial [Burkholderia sp. SIMBA_051]|uniref:hypothetical protein n=1 Tax=Burkholderia sp. SIMBA_051 TaxID=3085792 RepID=UPI00397B53EE
LLNPAVRAKGIKAMLFPGFEDNTSLEDAWHLLQSLGGSGAASLDSGPKRDKVPSVAEETQPSIAPGEEPDGVQQTKGGKDRL